MEDAKYRLGRSSSSRTYRTTQKNPSYLCIDFDDLEGHEDIIGDYPCPYCTEEFDLVELIGHIDDEHPLEAKSGVCPICGTRLRVDMVGHIILQHGSILQKLKLLKRESFVKEDLEDEYYPSLSPASSSVVSSMAPDPLLTFLNLSLNGDKDDHVQQNHLTETIAEEKNSNENMLERNAHQPPLSDQEHMEMTKKSKFVQGLLLSTIFDDDVYKS